MVTFCPECGKSIKAAFKFCPYCGKPLPTEEHEGSQTFVRPLSSSFRGKDQGLELVPGGGVRRMVRVFAEGAQSTLQPV